MPYTPLLIAVVAGYAWIIDPLFDVRGVWRHVPTVLVLGIAFTRAMRAREFGFTAAAFLPALAWVTAITLPAVIVLWVIGGALGPRPVRDDPWLDLLYLIFWGGGQQFVLQTVVLREMQQVKPRAGIGLAALVFAAFHLPNPLLTVVTFTGGLAWCWIYSRHPNIIPLAMSHACATLVILHAFDPRVTGYLRTGARYLGW